MEVASVRQLLNTLKSNGYTQLKIAELTGIPQPTLSRLSCGKTCRAGDRALRIKHLVDQLPALSATSIRDDS